MAPKKIIFRADGNQEIGLGHLSRLHSLAEMLKDSYDCVFLTKSDSSLHIIPEGFEVCVIPGSIEFSEEPLWISKNYSSSEFIIVADGYNFTGNYQKKLKKYKFALIYIDDMVHERMYADIVVNHSLNIKADDYIVNSNTRYALGSDYSLLRPLFINAARNTREIKQISQVFICFGGVDPYNLSNKALEGIVSIESVKKIHVVVGEFYDHNGSLFLTNGDNTKVIVYRSISEVQMTALMSKCQLAIVPSSTVSYEACSVKMLILAGYYVDNQKNIHDGLKSNGLIYNGDDFREYSSSDFKQKVMDIIDDKRANYKAIISNQSRLFDGQQKKRFNELIESIC